MKVSKVHCNLQTERSVISGPKRTGIVELEEFCLPDDRWLRETPPSVSAAALPPSALMRTALRGEEESGRRGKRAREKKDGRVIISLSTRAHTALYPLPNHYPLHLES